MLKLWGKNEKTVKLIAPLSGKLVRLEDVPDEVFSQKMVGDGIAIDPTSEFVLAPCDGTIGKIFKTNHAFSMLSPSGLELFIHYGIDTVTLSGQGFKRFVEPGAEVKAGDKILGADLEYLRVHAKSVVTSVVISNMEEVKKIVFSQEKEAIAGQTIILEIYL